MKRLKQIRQLCTEDLYESASTQTDPLLIDTTSIDKTTVPKQEEKKNINNLYLQNNKFKSLNTHWNQNLFTIQTPLLTSRSDPGFHKQFVYSYYGLLLIRVILQNQSRTLMRLLRY